MNFANPMLLAGIAALSIPIIIHLFHKSRFKIVKWGAMHLLEMVLRTNQKRIKIEQWILLFIRCCIPALLALAMARPIWEGARKLLGDSKSSTLVLLDNSYSMEATRSGTTHFSIARDEAQRVIEGLKNGSQAHVILMGQGGQGLLDSPTVDLTRITQALSKSTAAYGAAKVPAALDLAASVLEKSTVTEPVRQVVLMTDFQRVSFEATESKLLTSAIERLKSQTMPPTITLWDVGQEVRENVAIESLDFSRLMVGVGQRIQIRANLRNYGDANYPDLRVTLKVDGKDKAASQVSIGPGSRAQVLFSHAFEAAGSHIIEVFTEPDALAEDNTFVASIPVRDRLPLLLVDGAPAASLDDIKSETGYLQIALSPFAAGKVELSDLIEARTTSVEGFNAKALEGSQVVVLANVRKLGDDQLRMLEDFVKNGGGLLVFPGDRTDVSWWNGAFSKLAPLPLGALSGELKEGAAGVGIVSQRFENPALELFNDPRNGTMTEAAVRVWFKMRPPERSGGAEDPVILARLDTGDPFLVEKAFGQGRVIACATAADADWSNLPARPFYLPLVQRLGVYLASTVFPPRNLEVGQMLTSFLPLSMVGKKAVLTGPDGIPRDVPIVAKGPRGVVEFGPVYVPGIYTLLPAGDAPIYYAFNADRKESDLARLTETEVNELAKSLGVPVVRSFEEYQKLEQTARYGSELWKWVLLGLLVFLFMELLLQRRFATTRGNLKPAATIREREMEVAR